MRSRRSECRELNMTDDRGRMGCNRTPGAGPYDTDVTLNNWAHNVSVTPQRFCHPSTVDEFVSIVKEAEAAGASVRAVGSAWSFTDVMFTPGY